jgi:hypothetical protein
VSGNLPVPAGGGAVTVSTGGAVGEYVGDVSRDGRETSAALEVQRRGVAAADEALRRNVERVLGFRVSQERVLQVRALCMQDRDARDEHDKAAAEQVMRREWGRGYEQRIELIYGWLDTLPPELCAEILNARRIDNTNESGMASCNKPRILRAMVAAAEKVLHLALDREYARDQVTGNSDHGRIAELEAWMSAPKGSTDYRRYYDDPEAQAEYRDLLARRDGRAR